MPLGKPDLDETQPVSRGKPPKWLEEFVENFDNLTKITKKDYFALEDDKRPEVFWVTATELGVDNPTESPHRNRIHSTINRYAPGKVTVCIEERNRVKGEQVILIFPLPEKKNEENSKVMTA